MKWYKLAMAAFGVAITVAAATTSAHATTIPTDRIAIHEGRQLLDASGGPATYTISPTVGADKLVSGNVQLDLTSIQYWWARRFGQTTNAAITEGANSWNFTLEHAGVTADLGGLNGAVSDAWLKTSAFDGVVAAGDWILTATSDYYKTAKRMIEFNLNGFFDVVMAPTTSSGGTSSGGTSSGGTSSGGGQVPVPATAFLILAGLAGMSRARRKA